jgi:hypothetical protein
VLAGRWLREAVPRLAIRRERRRSAWSRPPPWRLRRGRCELRVPVAELLVFVGKRLALVAELRVFVAERLALVGKGRAFVAERRGSGRCLALERLVEERRLDLE